MLGVANERLGVCFCSCGSIVAFADPSPWLVAVYDCDSGLGFLGRFVDEEEKEAGRDC